LRDVVDQLHQDNSVNAVFHDHSLQLHIINQNNYVMYIVVLPPEDRWVVPYHPKTLLIWDARMNAQYVTFRGLGKYLTKYVVKPEPTHVFNVADGDKYREHVIARRL
ncbi:2757_t:CDS:1, partial [Paraglomus occultum]